MNVSRILVSQTSPTHSLLKALRIHPVVPANSRVCYKDTVIPVGGGPDGKSPVFVGKGTIVGYWTYAMHRRQDLYGPDADEFIPERWEKLRPGWEYLPFNGGPRICLGMYRYVSLVNIY
jgi:cytochrome P450